MLQRTFNLNITINPGGPEQKSQEIEFSMLDQADYTGIDQYIKHHGLNDASMAAQRKAQMYNVNGPDEDQSEDVAAAGDGETELEKAQRMLEDEEDEDEEDYDPGSEGESEGSGTSSDEDSDEDEEEGYEGDEGDEGNLVQDELGSEAEDVQLTDEE